MREVRKSIYNVSRPNHFGSIRKMPVRPEVATEREESQAEMPYEELKQKVAQYEQSKITPALEAQIRTLPRETGWSWHRGVEIDIYRQKEINEGVSTGSMSRPLYETSVEHMDLMQEQDMAYEDPNRSSSQHGKNYRNAVNAMKEIYEEAGYSVVKTSMSSGYTKLSISRYEDK